MVAGPLRPALAVGELSHSVLEKLRGAAHAAAFELDVARNSRDATLAVDKRCPGVVLVDSLDPVGKAAVLALRASAIHAQIPIIAIADPPNDLAFADTFSWGGDDVVSLNKEHQLTARLRFLPRDDPSPPVGGRGKALIADTDRVRRLMIGRVLRNAGYTVSFAVELADIQDRAAFEEPDLIVASAEITPAPRTAIDQARAVGVDATWIVTAPPRDLGHYGSQLEGLERAAITDGFAPPENILFLANELRSAGTSNQRASKRLLYGTTALFRNAGREEDDYGFTYNISKGGLYVRTLSPPDDDLVWIELTPPRVERRVRLLGHVAWRRRFGPNERATVPTGFGVRIVEMTQNCLHHWQAGYATFAEALG